MSKAQTDIRTTSYDELAARPFGYQGTIEDVLAQIRAEPNVPRNRLNGRAELLMFLGADRVPSAGPSVELDESPRYGLDEDTGPSKYSLEYAMKNFPGCFPVPGSFEVASRFAKLSQSQFQVYARARLAYGVLESLGIAEAYPYPAVRP